MTGTNKVSLEKHYLYRSNFERREAERLASMGVDFEYESEILPYITPATQHKYIPDIIIQPKHGHKLYIELKGLLSIEDRKKMILVKEQHPDKDIRMVFQNALNKLRKGSKTTYAEWARKHGIIWAHGGIPENWFITSDISPEACSRTYTKPKKRTKKKVAPVKTLRRAKSVSSSRRNTRRRVKKHLCIGVKRGRPPKGYKPPSKDGGNE